MAINKAQTCLKYFIQYGSVITLCGRIFYEVVDLYGYRYMGTIFQALTSMHCCQKVKRRCHAFFLAVCLIFETTE
jgi:hypothetical protein